MRILVTGDTHGQIDNVLEAAELLDIDYLIFTGDHYVDGEKIAKFLSIPYAGVKGNCDRNIKAVEEEVIKIGGKKILLIHGHLYGVKNTLDNIYYRGLEKEVDVVVFGHTHIPLCEQVDDLWLINPGSPTYPRAGKEETFAVVDIEDNIINPRIFAL